MQGNGNPDDLLSGEELIADESVDVAAEVMHKMDLETLRKALRSLSESEYRLIYDLFLSNPPMKEADVAKKLGKTQQMINKDKNRMLKKLRNFF